MDRLGTGVQQTAHTLVEILVQLNWAHVIVSTDLSARQIFVTYAWKGSPRSQLDQVDLDSRMRQRADLMVHQM